jgi:hypothetical protein
VRPALPQYAVVRFVTDRYEAEGAPRGAVGTILEIYDAPPGYEVEVSDNEGRTLFLGGVKRDEVEAAAT